MFDKFKPGKFFRYRYSPDDIVIQIKRVTEKTSDYVVVLVNWLSIDFEQEIKITKEDILSWEESK